ncbi:MAG: 30S ribosomal protein S12 methylthiotransferase accessory factor YcaO [Thiohalomonadaceae bacterium]
MPTETFIAGKDASLESSLARMRASLADLGFQVEERSWLNPVDNVWSVHVRERDCPLLFTNGKGASRDAALASALGEFFERLGTDYFWTHYYLGEANARGAFTHFPGERWFPLGDDGAWPEGLLTPELRRHYDPDGAVDAESLVDLNSGNAERGICALPYVRERDGARVWFSVNIIGNLYVSNGMSAGNTPTEARTQALSEIIERHVKFRIIAGGLCLPDVPEAVLARYPRIRAGVQALRDAGFGVLVRDASLGGKYPVMNVTLLNPDDQGCFASFGAHPRFEVAVERALTELLQGRALDALGGFPAPGFDADEVAHPQNLEMHFVDSSGIVGWPFLRDTPDFPFSDWDHAGTTEQEYAWLVACIHREGHDIYVLEHTDLGMYACRILVPGMSEIYPVDDLQWENNSIGNHLREALLHLPDLDAEECADLREELDALGLDDARPVAALIGLAADPDSAWAGLRIGELKTLLALAAGDEDGVREGCDWVRHFGHMDPARRRVYLCIDSLLRLEEPAPYEAALQQLYGTEALAQAQALLVGELRFPGLHAPGLTLEGCDLHQRLLRAYDKRHGRSAQVTRAAQA